jgi:peptide/nickel transport system permease protein
MEKTNLEIINTTESPEKVNEFKRFWRVFIKRRIVVFGLFAIIVVVLVALFAPILAPYDPYQQNLSIALQDPNRAHWLGTDNLGRDTLSRLIYGARTSLLVGIMAIGCAATIGMLLGMVAGYFGGLVNTIIMRIIDALMSFPMILKALVLGTLLGGGLTNVIIALTVAMLSVYCRLMCAQTLTVKENDYITASHSLGSSNFRIMFRHILPNCFPALIVLITLQLGTAILAEASLSFLGLGIDPPGAAWGAMVSDGRRFLSSHPVIALTPGLAIMFLVYGFNMVGDGLRDALDPRLRGVI